MTPQSLDVAGRREIGRNEGETRLYLLARRHAILAPIQSVAEICGILAGDQRIQACERVLEDVGRIRSTADRMTELINTFLSPGMVDGEATAKCLNHDLRGLLTIVIGYGEELRRKAPRDDLDAYHSEFVAISRLGREALGLIEETVKTLRSVSNPSPDEPDADDEIGGRIEPGKILVAEDDAAIRDLLCSYLQAQGHTVVCSVDGKEAIERLKGETFDLVLTDLVMPGADGFDVLRFLRANVQFTAVPAIVISGHGALEDIAKSIAMGAVDYLPKPFNRTILSARVGATLEKKRLRDRVEQQRQRNDDLLRSILPGPVADELIQTDTVVPRRTEHVAVLFADLVNFTAYCDQMKAEPERVLDHLRCMFEAWERMAQECGVEKIKTIGDAFMAAAGLLNPARNPALNCVRLGLRMIEFTRSMTDDQGKSLRFDLRVGIHVGPVVSGLLGRRQSLFDLWGDTVNLASRVESHGNPGCVNLSVDAWKQVQDLIRGEARELAVIKGKPEPVEIVHLDPASIRWV